MMGSGAMLSNSQCTLSALGSSFSETGNNFTVNLELSFAAAFTGLKTNYAYVVNNGGQNSGFQNLGSWNP
jgi:hypothetical protein